MTQYLKYIGICYIFIGLIYAIILFVVRQKQFYRFWLTGLINDIFLFILCLLFWPAWLIVSKIKYKQARYKAKMEATKQAHKQPKVTKEGPQPVRTN